MKKNSIDFDWVATEMVKAVRGKRSQNQLNRKLGFSVNQLYRWESGYRKITWKNFVQICSLSRVSIGEILKVEIGFFGDEREIKDLILHLKGQHSLTAFSKLVNLPNTKIRNWAQGRGQVNLSDVLKMIEGSLGVSTDIVAKICDINLVPSLLEVHKLRLFQRNICFQNPELMIMIHGVELLSRQALGASYWSQISGLTSLSEKRCKELVEIGIDAKYFEMKEQHLKVTISFIDTRGALKQTLDMRRFWINVALKKIDTIEDITKPHRLLYFIMSVSDHGAEKLQALMYQFISKMAELNRDDPGPSTQIRLINFQNILMGRETLLK